MPGHCKSVSLLASVESKERAKSLCEWRFLGAFLDMSCVVPFPGIPQLPRLQCGSFERSVAAASQKDRRPSRLRVSHLCTKGLKCHRVVADLIHLVSKIFVQKLLRYVRPIRISEETIISVQGCIEGALGHGCNCEKLQGRGSVDALCLNRFPSTGKIGLLDTLPNPSPFAEAKHARISTAPPTCFRQFSLLLLAESGDIGMSMAFVPVRIHYSAKQTRAVGQRFGGSDHSFEHWAAYMGWVRAH